jgi:hypothetical protein
MAKKKTICITCSKNDGDFIEVFIRYNSRYIDEFFIIDESTDNTKKILSLLIGEGYKITIFQNTSGQYVQSQICNTLLKENLGKFDYFFFLDVDEVLICIDDASWESCDIASIKTAQRALWIPHAPIRMLTSEQPITLATDFRPIKDSMVTIQKVSLSAAVARHCLVGPGSHNAINENRGNGDPLVMQEQQGFFSIAHFPVRSAAQLVTKIVKAYFHIVLKKGRRSGEGHHVDQIYEYLKLKDFLPNLSDLQFISATYGASSLATLSSDRKVDTQASVVPNISLKYFDLAAVNPVARIVSDTEQYVAELIAVRPNIS